VGKNDSHYFAYILDLFLVFLMPCLTVDLLRFSEESVARFKTTASLQEISNFSFSNFYI